MQNYLSSTTCLKELRLNFCSDKMKVEPILRAVADNDLLPFERVELQCERCQINNNVYEYLLTFIKKSTTLQSCPLKLLHINLLHSVNRDPALENKLLENLGLDVTVANNLQKLKHEIPKNVSNTLLSRER